MKSSARRSFLKAVGGAAASVPFFGMLSDSVAQSTGKALLLKFIGACHPHGVSAEYWAMRENDTETNFDITYSDCSLQPFDDAATYGKSFKDRILPIEGIDLLSSANGHDTAATILTGSRVSGKPSNTSLDQYLAHTIGLGADTRLAAFRRRRRNHRPRAVDGRERPKLERRGRLAQPEQPGPRGRLLDQRAGQRRLASPRRTGVLHQRQRQQRRGPLRIGPRGRLLGCRHLRCSIWLRCALGTHAHGNRGLGLRPARGRVHHGLRERPVHPGLPGRPLGHGDSS